MGAILTAHNKPSIRTSCIFHTALASCLSLPCILEYLPRGLEAIHGRAEHVVVLDLGLQYALLNCALRISLMFNHYQELMSRGVPGSLPCHPFCKCPVSSD